jgi:hypothetical protein
MLREFVHSVSFSHVTLSHVISLLVIITFSFSYKISRRAQTTDHLLSVIANVAARQNESVEVHEDHELIMYNFLKEQET